MFVPFMRRMVVSRVVTIIVSGGFCFDRLYAGHLRMGWLMYVRRRIVTNVTNVIVSARSVFMFGVLMPMPVRICI